MSGDTDLRPSATVEDFGDRFFRFAAESPNEVALVCDERERTYGELAVHIRRIAGALLRSGLDPGDNRFVGVLATNSIEFATIIAATHCAGYCIVPIPTLISEADQARMISDSGVGILFASGDIRAKAQRALELSGRESSVVKVGFDFDDAGWTSYDAWTDMVDESVVIGPTDPASEANLIYSSGTTGVPKGIVHTHGARTAQAAAVAGFSFCRQTQLINTVGLYSNHGLVTVTLTLYWGGCALFMSKFSTDRVIDYYAHRKPTIAWVVPATLIRLLADPRLPGAVAGRQTFKLCSGAPLSAAQKAETVAVWPGTFVEVYGQTETGILSVLVVNGTPDDKLGSVGKISAIADVRILGPDDEILPIGADGEIVAHTPAMLDAYHCLPEATAEITWHDSTGRRFVRTGDLGRIDSDGYLWLLDRKKDMMISGGYNIYAADIERIIIDHPEVLEVGVVGAPSDRWGETPVAFVQVREGAKVSEEELRSWANERLGAVQRIAAVVFHQDLPRGSLGKILKGDLRTEVENRRLRFA